MSTLNDEIRKAIDSMDFDEARKLLKSALKQNPDADTYYLASLVSVNDNQKQEFLKKAIDLDPFHKEAQNSLGGTSQTQSRIATSIPSNTGNKAEISKSQKSNTNYIGMFIVAIFGCFVCLALEWSLRDNNLLLMLCMFPAVMFAGAYVGWFTLAKITKSEVNPFANLRSSRLSFGLIGSILGFSLGLYIMEEIYFFKCGLAPDTASYDACLLRSDVIFVPIPILLVLTIVGLLIGIGCAYLFRRNKA